MEQENTLTTPVDESKVWFSDRPEDLPTIKLLIRLEVPLQVDWITDATSWVNLDSQYTADNKEALIRSVGQKWHRRFRLKPKA